MANVRSVEGIFRKLGKKAAIDFLAGYVYSKVRSMANQPIGEIANFLEISKPKFGRDWTYADEAVQTFNSMF